jgi:hypothetical protein
MTGFLGLQEFDPEGDVRIVPHMRLTSSDLASLFVFDSHGRARNAEFVSAHAGPRRHSLATVLVHIHADLTLPH